MSRLRRVVVTLAVTTSLMLVLSANAPQTDVRPRLDQMWPHGQVTDLDGRAVSLAGLRARLASSVWVLRIQAAWCGTCQWHAAWTPTLAARYPDQVSVIDLVFADEDNQPADVETGRRWRDRSAGTTALTLVGDAAALHASFRAPAPLPRILVVDARTLSVVATVANPDPDRVIQAVEQALHPGVPASPARRALIDGLFTADQWALIEGMRLGWSPPDPSNRVADDRDAAALGFYFFFDKMLSPAGVACSSCHNAERLFADGQRVPNDGAGHGRRNMPTVLLADHARSQLWDGRADSLWSQAVMPFEDPNEMASSRLFVAHGVRDRHWGGYEAVFGPLPALDERSRFPADGRPGTAAWDRMRAEDRDAVSRVFANVGKAIAAFERSLHVAPIVLDRYAAGDYTALSAAEKDGLAAFLDAGCAQCHFGPRLSNDAFHNLRFPTGRVDGLPDRGRAEGLPVLLANEFAKHGPFSDAPISRRVPAAGDHAEGAFRTPGLRLASATMPYGHGGGFDDLMSVIDAHRTGGLPADSPFTTGNAEPWAQGFDPSLTRRIARFLEGLGAGAR